MSEFARKRSIRVLIYRTEEFWIAQCIEVNLCTCADSLEELIENVDRQLQTQIYLDRDAGCEPFSSLKPAPERFHRRFERAQPFDWPKEAKSEFQPLVAMAS